MNRCQGSDYSQNKGSYTREDTGTRFWVTRTPRLSVTDLRSPCVLSPFLFTQNNTVVGTRLPTKGLMFDDGGMSSPVSRSGKNRSCFVPEDIPDDPGRCIFVALWICRKRDDWWGIPPDGLSEKYPTFRLRTTILSFRRGCPTSGSRLLNEFGGLSSPLKKRERD